MRFAALFLAVTAAFAQPVAKFDWQPLWPNGAPGATGTEDGDKPAISLFKAAHPNGEAVVIYPGGGYGAQNLGVRADVLAVHVVETIRGCSVERRADERRFGGVDALQHRDSAS